MLDREVYRKLVAKKYDFSDVPGYREGKFEQLAADAVFAAMAADRFSRNPACEAEDYFQEMMKKALEKPSRYDAVYDTKKRLKSAVYSTTRHIAVDMWKKGKDWTGTKQYLDRVSIEDISELPAPVNDSSKEDLAERINLIGPVLAALAKALPRQMDTELVRSNPDNPLTIKKTAKMRGLSTKAVTNHQRALRKHAWEHHADVRRQLFGPHRATKLGSRRKRHKA